LLAGCGDVAARIVQQLGGQNSHYRIRALLRHAPGSPIWTHWRTLGATPIAADLDRPRSLRRLRGIADNVIYLAPPADDANDSSGRPADRRLNRFLAALHGACSLPRRLVLISTTGVYGDHHGARIDESVPIRPQSARGLRRAAAEQTLRGWRRGRCRAGLTHAPKQRQAGGVLRVPGIYAATRLPVERLRANTPALRPDDDTWTNHIHADDLARISWLALARSRTLRAVNTCDHSQLKMGDWFDVVADATGLPRPQRLSREQLKSRVSPMLYSFMSESRRLDNTRLTRELRIRLLYPTVYDFLSTLKTPLC
jgi:nucleoside-diphosphate-sugar epimerase